MSHTDSILLNFTISSPLSFYDQFSNANASSKVTYAPNWDFFVFGTASSLVFDGQTV